MLLAVDDVDPDVKMESKVGETPLMRAAKSGHGEVVDVLLATERVDVNAQDREGSRPLLRATEWSHETVIQRLLAVPGVDLHACDLYGRNVLTCAAMRGDAALVDLLLKHGVDPQPRYNMNNFPLFEAIRAGSEEVVDLLLRSGLIDIEATDEDEQTALTIAADCGHGGIVQKLLATGPNADIKDVFGETPLSKAVQGGWVEVVGILLNTEAVDRDSQDTNGRTPLSRAAEDGFIEVVDLLLAAGVDRDIADDEGKIPLQWAEEYGNEIIADLLRDRE